ncbi:RimJ/RimL family protein N-acetyltransferase [Clostridium acetobutylicum]|uniref:Predicted acetyltransferase n=1 Tax=Clostridium acetobutylicum (strain ATCC 824 / DSM 792 / JCM 1419 / IAM 19013 / LMG 5710 / NBRC 13948 / NRRL B-527 / VKM B-1787 / 2291 / W) TaxID=272562 RepID=Q97G11_CLOAB|nr:MULTISPECIES: GNAT family protein [Clostridium]AAK80512.1 Predicted acetyltransferase [Clostridium acetobutylicum ATCC 824]ADZ21611.1 acetyltransferase [Clostridium acetobutylicum EA 2018]AEI32434.1 acetyltransferase [Clostridium acetobutylicum DSM 1731]AWV79071.1 N-acetyltransferase [Clostridium acetobutylicum]MBC2394968.1 GNAT family N-acetyltransferase [Clostridium acetobutylicum]
MVRLRPYRSCDAKYIVTWISSEEEFVKWCANLITYPFTEESMNKIQESFENNEKGWLFTAIDKKGTPIGFMSMSKADYENDSVHLGFIIVDSSKRSSGFGKQMINQAIKYAFEILNVSRVTLKVFDNNSTAHYCYQNVGFVDEKYMEKEFPYKDEMWGCYCMAIQK